MHTPFLFFLPSLFRSLPFRSRICECIVRRVGIQFQLPPHASSHERASATALIALVLCLGFFFTLGKVRRYAGLVRVVRVRSVSAV